MIHMKCQELFSLKKKKSECCLLQILLGTLSLKLIIFCDICTNYLDGLNTFNRQGFTFQMCSVEEYKWGDHSHFKLGCAHQLVSSELS